MRKTIIMILVVLFCAISAYSIIDDEHRLIQAHTIPTAYTLNEDEFQVGIGPVYYGITEDFQVGTNMLSNILGVFNADAKYNFLDKPGLGLAGGAGWMYFKIADDSYNALLLSLNASFVLKSNLKLHTGGTVALIPDFDLDEDTTYTGGAASGTMVPVELEYNLSEHSAILAGAGYDLSFGAFSAGASYLHSWEKFNLKVGAHYTAGDGWDYITPIIGLWWRW